MRECVYKGRCVGRGMCVICAGMCVYKEMCAREFV